MKKLVIFLFPIFIISIIIFFTKLNYKKFNPPPGAGTTMEELDLLRADWKKIAHSNGLISIKDTEKVTTKMSELLNQTGLCAPVHACTNIVSVARYEDATELQKTELIKATYALLHSMNVGDWEELRNTRLPVPGYKIPKYAADSIPYLEKVLGIPEDEKGKYTFEQIQEKLFKAYYKRSTYWDSICMLSSNAFALSNWNTNKDGTCGWLCIPQSEGITKKYLTEYKCHYDYSDNIIKIIEKDKKLLVCTYTFMAEGNPSGAVRPCRFDFVWDSINEKWLPDMFMRALADYEVPGATNSENTVAWVQF